MRIALVLAVAVAATLAGCERKPADSPKTPAPPGSGPVAATMPHRAPGLWEQTVSTGGVSQTSRLCLDKAVEARFTVWGQQASQGACSQTKLTSRIGGGWDFASTCDLGESGKTSTQGSVTGDLAKAYKVTAQSTTTGAAAPQMNGAQAMTLQATWKGPCPTGMAPGDMLLPGGVKINMMQMAKG